jgi:hypothetical protein
MRRAVLLALLAGASCNQIFGLKPTALDDSGGGGGGGGGDGTEPCGGSCVAPLVCDTARMECVACTATQHDSCADDTPVCGSDDTCRGCAAHAECASDVCLPGGPCAVASTVAYVVGSDFTGGDGIGRLDPGSDADCTQAFPCATVAAAESSSPPRNTVKVRGTLIGTTAFQLDVNLTIIGDADATLDGSGSASVALAGNIHAALIDLSITHGAPGIKSGGGGLSSLDITHCQIANNATYGVQLETVGSSAINLHMSRSTVEYNPSGGLSLSFVSFALVGNVIAFNGSATSAIGGLDFANEPDGSASLLELNTIADNHSEASGSAAPGVRCGSNANVFADSNIIAHNTKANDLLTQVSGTTCTFIYTIVAAACTDGSNGSGATGLTDGVGSNRVTDPFFESDGSAAGSNVCLNVEGSGSPNDLHPGPQSPAIGHADPSLPLTGLAAVDLDGLPRVAPADTGAYHHALH